MRLQSLRAAFRIGDLRRRIFFTFLMFLVFRIGVHVPVPGIDTEIIKDLFREGSLFGLLDLFSGGALRSFSVFAMNIYPYINASIIMQLLTMVIPAWEKMSKEEDGKKKLQQYVRYGTVVLGFIQGVGMGFAIRSQGALVNPSSFHVVTIGVTLTAGTVFLMWLGELITDKGIGNGISLIIFAGIVSALPGGLVNMMRLTLAGRISIFNIAALGVMGALLIVAIIWVTEGERRIPVQYAKRVVGRKMYGGQSTHIPMRINQAGVIPVIFASSVLAFPATIASFINAPWARTVEQLFDFRKPLYMITYAALIMFFTYFYTAMTFNPAEVADNMKKYGGFIPGYRPGRPTTEYLDRVLTRITLVGAVFLASVAVLPNIIMNLTNIPGASFSGTALIIVVGVALETMKQIEAHLIMRNYRGFMK